MNRSRWLYRVAAVTFAMALIVFATPTLATVEALSIGDVTFGWGHVLVLITCGALYGDMRTNIARDREEKRREREESLKDQHQHREEVRAEFKELRSEIRELWAERR